MNSASAGSKAYHPDPRRPLPTGAELHGREPARVVADVRRGDARTTMALVVCYGRLCNAPPKLGPRLLEANLVGAVLDHYAFPASIHEDTSPGNTAANDDGPAYEPLKNKLQALVMLFNILSAFFRDENVVLELQAKYRQEVSEQLKPLLACLSLDNPNRLLLGEHFHWKFAVGAVTMFIHNTCMFKFDQQWWDRFRCFDKLVPLDHAINAVVGNAVASCSTSTSPYNSKMFDQFMTSVIHFCLALRHDAWFAEEVNRFPEEREVWLQCSHAFSKHVGLAVIQLYSLGAREIITHHEVNKSQMASVTQFSRATCLRVVERWGGARFRRHIVDQVWPKAEVQLATGQLHGASAVHVEAYRLAYQILVNTQKMLSAETLLLHAHKDNRAEFLQHRGCRLFFLKESSHTMVWTEETERAVADFEKDSEGVREAKILAANLLKGARKMPPDSVQCFVDMAWQCLMERKHVDLLANRHRMSEDRRLAAMVKHGLVQGLLQMIVCRQDCHMNRDIIGPMKELCIAVTDAVTLPETKAALEEVILEEKKQLESAGSSSNYGLAATQAIKPKKSRKRIRKRKGKTKQFPLGISRLTTEEQTKIWPLITLVQNMYPIGSRSTGEGVHRDMSEALEAITALATALRPKAVVDATVSPYVKQLEVASAWALAPEPSPETSPETSSLHPGDSVQGRKGIIPIKDTYMGCKVCLKVLTPETIKYCSKCKYPYCSRKCQKVDWKNGHKKTCKIRQKSLVSDEAKMAKMTENDAKQWLERNQNWSKNVANLFQQRFGTLFMMGYCLDLLPNEVVYIIDYSVGSNPTAETVSIKDFLWKHYAFMNSGEDKESLKHTEFLVKRNADAMAQTVFGVDPNGGVLVKTVRVPPSLIVQLSMMVDELGVPWDEYDAAEKARTWDRWKRYGDIHIDAAVSKF